MRIVPYVRLCAAPRIFVWLRGISSVEQLVASSATELLTIRTLGPKSLREIVVVLRARGYELRQ
jgi:DNA-directed RNA polymerase alpha subunit